MNKIKKILRPVYHYFVRLAKWRRRIGLRSTDFSIISNNCTGGYVYQYFGISYKTPTEGLYFTTEDYLKIVERPEYYFNHKVELIDANESVLAQKGKKITYPVGRIGDVEIYFMHYPDPKEALSKWHRRASRINFEKMFFLLTETELMKIEHINKFVELLDDSITPPEKRRGICLTLQNYALPSTLFVSGVPKDENNGNASWRPEIILKCINWKKVLNDL